MKIVIDARFWGPSHTGLGVYTANLVKYLAKIDQKNKYLLLVREEVAEMAMLPANFTTKIVDARAYTFKEQILLPYVLYCENPDLVHFTSINVPVLYFGKYVVTVHDLIKHYSRGKDTTTHNPVFYWFKYLIYLLTFRWAVKLSRKIIVPSKNVKNLLLEKFSLPSEKIVPVYEAAELTKEIDTRKIVLPEKFGLYVGNAYPHKNLDTLLKAWKDVYRQTGFKLVLVCGRSAFSKKYEQIISRENAAEYISFLGYLEEGQLKYTHQKAGVYVFPTLMEGFGIPGLDAMAMGIPVVCSDIDVLHEIYGSAASYFRPQDTSDIAAKVITVIRDKEIRRKLIKNGQVQVKKYSWEKMAGETLKIYESCLSLRSGQ